VLEAFVQVFVKTFVQWFEPSQHPIAYYLKTIVDAELNYHIYNKEMLAIIFSF